MAGHSTHQPHGSGVRGLSNTKGIGGPAKAAEPIDLCYRFGRMFQAGTTKWSEDDLCRLAEAMKSGDDKGKDRADAEESNFGSAYTYFGQFVDHDLTFVQPIAHER